MATLKQKIAVDKTLENLGSETPKPMGEILKESGYADSIADNPQIITESKGFKELMEEAMPNDYLSQKHKELFEQKQLSYFVFPKKMEDGEIHGHVEAAGLKLIVIRESDKGKMAFYSLDDANAKKNALDMAFKLKGAYAPAKTDITTGGERLPSTDLDALAAAMAEQLRKSKADKPNE